MKLKMDARTFNALLGLAHICKAVPGGVSTITPKALAEYSRRSGEAGKLMTHILHEIPPHADKDPQDLQDALDEAERLIG